MLRQESITVLPGFKWPPIFAEYYLMMILIEKEITEMNSDIDRVNNLVFSLNGYPPFAIISSTPQFTLIVLINY